MNLIGMMFNYNEGDILAEVLEDAAKHVDTLFIADDESTDDSWNIIQDFSKRNPDKVEYTRRERNPKDKGQRQALLTEIQKRYKPEDTWVQVIESDIMILDTDIRKALERFAVHDIAMSWIALNAVRDPGTWDEFDTYPNWDLPIKEIMPKAHWMEVMLYTFRPLPGIEFNLDVWRPWPRGFSKYCGNKPVKTSNGKSLETPLLAHYGYRGPTHFYKKFKAMGAGNFHSKYKSWDLRSVESVRDTVSFFNGEWNNNPFDMSRDGWKGYRKG